MEVLLKLVIVNFLTSFFLNWWLCKKAKPNSNNLTELQHIHIYPVARVGGAGVFGSVMVSLFFFSDQLGQVSVLTLLAALPAAVLGWLEDVQSNVSAIFRLLGTILSGFLFYKLVSYSIKHCDILICDYIVSIELIAVFLTILAFAACANGFNMIDGLHGLASGSAMIMLAAFSFVSFAVDDKELGFLSISVFASVMGFWVLNFPFGKIFLGDGGAYFLGLVIASIAVMITERNELVSPFFSLIIVIYPIYEVARSTIRRLNIASSKTFQADRGHIHSVWFQLIQNKTDYNPVLQNSFAGGTSLLLPILSCTIAMFYYSNTAVLVCALVGFIIAFEILIHLVKSGN